MELNPELAHARYHLALTLFHLGEALSEVELYQKAIEHFQYLVEREIEEERIHLDFGILLIHFGLLIHDPNHPDVSHAIYCQAENQLMQAAALGQTQVYYSLAGLYSITGCYDLAMHQLERAQGANTLPSIEDLLHDEWLEGVRRTASFRQLIHELSSRKSSHDSLD